MKKKWIVLLLALVLGLSLLPTAALADDTHTAGLYFRPLEEGPDEPLHENQEVSYIRLDKLELAPYVDRMSMALYYYNRTDYVPVERVRLPRKHDPFDGFQPDKGPAFDIMKVDERVEGEQVQNNWYYLSAFDFSYGVLEYFADPDSDAPTGAIPLDSHQLPETAFYANSAGEPCEAAYRMYAVMDKNTDTDKSYRYSTTLYLRSTSEHIQLTDEDGKNTVICFQKQYDRHGNERYEQPYEAFEADIKRIDDKTLAVTVYANDTDLLLRLCGPKDHVEGCDDPDCDDPYEYTSYVDLLACDNTRLHLNDQGFEAVKYLPRHLFWQLAEKHLPITLSADAYDADITFDKDQTAVIADATTAALAMAAVPADDVMGLVRQENSDAAFVGAVDITLTCDGDAQHQLTGKATVSYPCEAPDDGRAVKVCYVDGETATLMDAKYENGCVTFTTDHFSTFVIVTVPASATPDAPEPTAQLNNGSLCVQNIPDAAKTVLAAFYDGAGKLHSVRQASASTAGVSFGIPTGWTGTWKVFLTDDGSAPVSVALGGGSVREPN